MSLFSALSEKPKARALAWVVCIVGLTLCLVCGQQAAWLAQRGGYQTTGYTTVVENEVNQVLQDYTQTIAQEYTLARENDGSVEAVRYLIDDENFGFQIVRDRGAVLLSQNTIDEEAYALTCTVHTSFTPTETTTFQETYATESEREQALETLYRQYEDVEYSYGSVGTEEETGRYTLFATCFSQGDPVPVTVTGYATTDLRSSPSELFCAFQFSSSMLTSRYDFLIAAVVGGVLGALALALLVYGAGRLRNQDGTLSLSWLDRKVPADLLGAGMAVVAILWLLLGGLSVSSVAEDTLSILPAGPLVGTGVVVALLAMGCVSLARRYRAGVLGENLTFRRYRGKIPHPRDLWHRFLHFFLQFWAAGLCFVGLCILEFICLYMYQATMDESAVLVWGVLKVLEGILVIYVILAMKEIRAGGDQLAAGNLDYQVPTNRLYGEFRKHGENLNNLRGGIQHAVEEQMKSERMKTELITNVSHDIKTPLTSIVSYVDLLKKEPMPTDQAKEYLDVLDRQAARLKKLIEDLVEASKASTGSLTVNFQPTDVNVLLSQSAGEYQEKLAARDLTLILTPAEEAPMISADGQLLWRVFENLLSNALKYAMPGTRVYLSCETTDQAVVIAFRNISASPLNISAEELMDRFVRGDASRNTEGSGLGLAIARDLTQLQRGTFALTIDGDLFKATLTFPRCQKTQDPAGK
ncbi:MAG TPA: HAMP domain-containing histidine kinase [Candidatus Evtepia excrementipullorum]|nr:HAMP domain-containing histidine kinase [Candidatus Evtepia excrementipullorum]